MTVSKIFSINKWEILIYLSIYVFADKCDGLPDLTMIDAETNCRGYWECMGERAMPYCCAIGFMYDAANARCVEDIDEVCNDTCFNDVPQKPGILS